MKKRNLYALSAVVSLSAAVSLPFTSFGAVKTVSFEKNAGIILTNAACKSGQASERLPFAGGQIIVSGGCTQGTQGQSWNLSDLLQPSCGSGLQGIGCGLDGIFPDCGASCGFGGHGSGCGGNDSGAGDFGSHLPGADVPSDDNGLEDSDASLYASQVVSLVNSERAKAGLSSVTVNSDASKAAMTRAKEIARSFSHTRPDGRNFSTALTDAGISYNVSGENIAYGQVSAQSVMTDWMNSAGHRANILNSQYTQIGAACFQAPDGTNYWVQLFLN